MIKEFQQLLHKEIPLTQDMGLEIISFDDEKLQVKAPLINNINDKGSVFGGSSSALMIISAWSLIKLSCNKHNIDADIVIHKNSTTWHKALYTDLVINAKLVKAYDFSDVKGKLADKRHQRINCIIELVDKEGVLFATMNANYVIINQSSQ